MTTKAIEDPGYAHGETSQETVTARLKWFNATKGFGFLVPEDDPCDAFVHITTLQDADITELGEGARLKCTIVKGPKGALITAVEEMLDIGVAPTPISHRIDDENEETIETMTGTVKWYKPDKGFGFIIPEDKQKDVFIHKTCLERHNINILIPGQKVSMRVRIVPKGREVIDFDFVDATSSEEESPAQGEAS